MRKHASRIYLGIIFAILYIPILTLILFSFNSSESTSVFAGFDIKWYVELFKSSDAFEALRNTLVLAVLSALLATVIGTAAAEGIYKIRSKFIKTAIISVTNVPMMNPDIVTGVSLMLLFVFVGRFIGAADSLSFVTLLIAHVTFNLPYVILNVLPKLRGMDRSLVEAAMDLGCTPVSSFFKVVLPEIMPGIFSGALMAFTLSLDDFVISYFTSGADFQTLPLYMYSITRKNVKPDIYALSTIVFVVILLLLLLSNMIQIKSDKKKMGRK